MFSIEYNHRFDVYNRKQNRTSLDMRLSRKSQTAEKAPRKPPKRGSKADPHQGKGLRAEAVRGDSRAVDGIEYLQLLARGDVVRLGLLPADYFQELDLADRHLMALKLVPINIRAQAVKEIAQYQKRKLAAEPPEAERRQFQNVNVEVYLPDNGRDSKTKIRRRQEDWQ